MKEQDSSTAKKELLLALACFLAAAFLWAFQARLEQGQLAERIAPHILRFHVLANSNSAADQEIKIEVKSFLLERIYGHLGEDAAKSDVVAYLEAERQTLEAEAEQFIRRLGKEQTVSLDVVWCANSPPVHMRRPRSGSDRGGGGIGGASFTQRYASQKALWPQSLKVPSKSLRSSFPRKTFRPCMLSAP